MASKEPTKLEKESLEAHVDLCALRYENLDNRLTKIETKVEDIHEDITKGNKATVRVIVGAVGTIVAGLLSTIVVLLVNF
jgi:tetrahydromethanopterin S-methyltransferase subunit G